MSRAWPGIGARNCVTGLALHPFFLNSVGPGLVCSPVFSNQPPVFSGDLRKLLTDFRSFRFPRSNHEFFLRRKGVPTSEKSVHRRRVAGFLAWAILSHLKNKKMSKTTVSREPDQTDEEDTLSSATAFAALLFLAEKFPYRQFNASELTLLSGIGRTAMSQIKNAQDTPFSLGKCTLQRLDAWLHLRPGYKQN